MQLKLPSKYLGVREVLVAVVPHEDQQLNRVSVVSNPFSSRVDGILAEFRGSLSGR